MKKPNVKPTVKPRPPEPKGPSLDEVVRDVKRFVAKAIDSGVFCIYVGYVEDGIHFSEHKSGGMVAGDILWLGKQIAADVDKTVANSHPGEGPVKGRKP